MAEERGHEQKSVHKLPFSQKLIFSCYGLLFLVVGLVPNLLVVVVYR